MQEYNFTSGEKKQTKTKKKTAKKWANETRKEAKYSWRTDHKRFWESNIYDEIIVTTTKLLFSIEWKENITMQQPQQW